VGSLAGNRSLPRGEFDRLAELLDELELQVSRNCKELDEQSHRLADSQTVPRLQKLINELEAQVSRNRTELDMQFRATGRPSSYRYRAGHIVPRVPAAVSHGASARCQPSSR
jgi:hypothetical protein